MRESSVFTFLKGKYRDLYDLCEVMEKLIVVRKYPLAMATAKVILDLFCKQTDNDLVLTIDVFNDASLTLSERDMQVSIRYCSHISMKIILNQSSNF